MIEDAAGIVKPSRSVEDCQLCGSVSDPIIVWGSKGLAQLLEGCPLESRQQVGKFAVMTVLKERGIPLPGSLRPHPHGCESRGNENDDNRGQGHVRGLTDSVKLRRGRRTERAARRNGDAVHVS